MIRTDESLLEYFRGKPNCEFCNRPSPGRLEPHHVLTRGHSGGSRLDVALNLVALCPGLYGGQCHTRFGDDPRYLERFLGIVARREGLADGREVQECIWRLLRGPKASVLAVLEEDEIEKLPGW